ncbi:unnamed protein product [Bursaphelenchus okinawaensis]|uniref:F-box domain-containing protein n=1 Tax=Bursaphelenchus okinawaensis TaxID=465554 RepID=A0A811LC27_9BILA|nr:unnamed protein product [Bursaphelenchus okinawaensis]CAG9120433.1 unnamed protein product [Bursaphelenchus okinawaensis]
MTKDHSILKKNVFLEDLPEKVWQIILAKMVNIDSLAALAATNKTFYKRINRDFKSMCYSDGIYRLVGETWATAFSLTAHRAFDLLCGVTCPHSGTFAFYLRPHYVVLSHIDFSNFKFELLDFKDQLRAPIMKVSVINKGKRLIIHCQNSINDQFAYLYDIETKQILRSFETTDVQFKDYTQLLDNNIVYDPYSNKEFEIPPGMRRYRPQHSDTFSEHRYIAGDDG